MKLSGKVVVVTGGGSGIGQQIVLTLLGKGARVAAVDINAAALQETQAQAGTLDSQLTLHQTDISDRDAVTQLVAEVVRQHSCVDVLINNAGIIHPFKSLHALEVGVIDKVIKVNLFGVINMTKAFLPLLLERPVAHIVNVSSMGGLFAFPKQTLYGATKAAVKLISEGLYSELRKTNVGVTVVFPGAVKTDITRNCDAYPVKLDRFSHLRYGTSAATAALRIVSAIEKNRFSVHIGADAKILGFLYRVFPRWTVMVLGRLMDIVLPD